MSGSGFVPAFFREVGYTMAANSCSFRDRGSWTPASLILARTVLTVPREVSAAPAVSRWFNPAVLYFRMSLILPMALLLMFMLLTIALGTWWNVEGGLFKCPGFLFKYSRTGVQIPPDYCSNISGLVFKFRRKNVQMFPDTCSSSTGFLFKYFGFLVQMRPDYASTYHTNKDTRNT